MTDDQSVLILGAGYLGRRVGRRLLDRGVRVFGTTRSAGRAAELAALGIEPVLADVLDPGSLERLPAADRVVYDVGFDRTQGASMRSVYVDGLRATLDRLPGPIRRFVYVGSTGVYGQEDGDWVDEGSPTEPRHESGRVCLEAERALWESAGLREVPAIVLRLAGLYGPGRIVGATALRRGEPISGLPDKFLNWIQVDDAAGACLAALDRGEAGRVYLAADDRPIARLEYYRLLAGLLGVAAPRFEPLAPGSDTGRRSDANRKVRNRRIRAELGVAWNYPDIRTGLPAALEAERAGSPMP